MTTLFRQARDGRPLSVRPFIDLHGHLGRCGFGVPRATEAAGLVRAMDLLGVEKLFISHMACMTCRAAWGNDQVAEAVREHPGRLEGYMAFWPSSPDEVEREARRCLNELGFRAIKMHNVNRVAYTHEAYRPAWCLASELRLPVLLHAWGDQPTMEQIRSLSETYPGASILVAHAGSGDVDLTIATAKACENVYLDLAFSAGPRGLVARLVHEVGAEKITYGSDSLFFSMRHQVGKVVGAEIAEEDMARILGGNAQAILERRRSLS